MELTDMSKHILWTKRKYEKLQPKGIFIQEGIFNLKSQEGHFQNLKVTLCLMESRN